VSREALHAVVGRAVLDEAFRRALFADPVAALIGYELRDEEVAALKRVDAESLDACARSIGRRLAVSIPTVSTPNSVPGKG
jgi:hypothetical protein